MIPRFDVEVSIEVPDGDCGYPRSEDISEEGFGYFRGGWFIGRAYLKDAQSVVSAEIEILEILTELADDTQSYEESALLVESPPGTQDELPDGVRMSDLMRFIVPDDENPDGTSGSGLWGLEVGVAGLTYALSATGFLTAASCRSHHPTSWSDCPVVFFAAHAWRATLLAELAGQHGCGVAPGREMLTVYAPSVENLTSLASAVLAERTSFRRNPNPRHRRSRSIDPAFTAEQLRLSI